MPICINGDEVVLGGEYQWRDGQVVIIRQLNHSPYSAFYMCAASLVGTPKRVEIIYDDGWRICPDEMDPQDLMSRAYFDVSPTTMGFRQLNKCVKELSER